jgi:hypothetical protein
MTYRRRIMPGMQIWLALAFATMFGSSFDAAPAAAAPQAERQELTTSAIMSAPDRYLNHPVELVIVEPLRGPASAQALAALEYGQVRVDVPDGGPYDLSLVPSAFRLDDANRYKKKFDRPLMPPIKVRGELLLDPAFTHRKSYVIRVASYEVLSPPTPRPVRSLAEIDADPAKWDRQRIVYEGTYESGFEVSTLDRKIWLGFSAATALVDAPARRAGTHRVRVTGYLFAKPGAGYGHLGGCAYQLVADKIEFL